MFYKVSSFLFSFSVNIQSQLDKWDEVKFRGDKASKGYPVVERKPSSSRAPSKEFLWYNMFLDLYRELAQLLGAFTLAFSRLVHGLLLRRYRKFLDCSYYVTTIALTKG